MSCKYIFILQLPEDRRKNYVGILDDKYQYSSFNLHVKAKSLTAAVAQPLKSKLLSLELDSNTQIVMSNTIGKSHPIYVLLSIARKLVGFNLSTVSTEKAFKRITAYHSSYSIGRDFKIQDYNKLYKKLLAHDDCAWISKDIDMQLQMSSRATYRIQRILRVCMYYMCIKQYFLSRNSK